MFSMIHTFVTRTSTPNRLSLTDLLSYLYLGMGTLLMFGPIIWLVLSSFKTPAGLIEFPPTLFPYSQESVDVEGYDEPLPYFRVTMEDGSTRDLAQIRRIGIEAQLVDPAAPDEIVKVPIDSREPIRSLQFAWNNYTEPLERFDFLIFLRNSLVVTITATALTLLINSMAAFALSKYQFRGKNATFVVIISTLLIPVSVILVPVFLVITQIGWNNNLLGVIVPGAATPTGVFLLRQYMLTIPDELIEAARIDGAGEWRIYWQIVLPLARPALAVLTIFSVMWRWNDFLWPLIVLSRSELFTLQVGLNSFQGQFNVQWNYILSMTVLTLLPITLVFAFLQKFITSGIASTGIKG